MSALTQTVNERLAAAVIANGGTASRLTMTTNQLLAALYNAVSAGPDLSAKTTNFFELLESTRNALSSGADLTSETTGWDTLLDEILTLGEAGGGGGGAYTTGAVAFDGATRLLNAALTATDRTGWTMSAWYFLPAPLVGDDFCSGLWCSDPNNYYNYCVLKQELGVEATAGDPAGDTFVGFWNRAVSPGYLGTWHHILVSVDTSSVAPHAMKVYVDRADVTPSLNDNEGSAHTIPLNGLPFYVGDDGIGPLPSGAVAYLNGYLADFWFDSRTVLEAGALPGATLDKFVDVSLKPVDLGAAGATPTGSQPVIFLRRAPAAAASTFLTNLGDGGNFVADDGALSSAPSAPSDTLPALDPPGWVPYGASDYADFANNRGYFAGQAYADISSMWDDATYTPVVGPLFTVMAALNKAIVFEFDDLTATGGGYKVFDAAFDHGLDNYDTGGTWYATDEYGDFDPVGSRAAGEQRISIQVDDATGVLASIRSGASVLTGPSFIPITADPANCKIGSAEKSPLSVAFYPNDQTANEMRTLSGLPSSTIDITGTPTASGNVSVAYSWAGPAIAGGTFPLKLFITGNTLPAGLTLNTATGAITGTPTTVQNQTGLYLNVNDYYGHYDSLGPFAIDISP